MKLRYKELVLKMPSLCQANSKHGKSGKWCGRASAGMMYNYYMATRAGGFDHALDRFVINQRDRAPYNLIYKDTGKLAAERYVLFEPLVRAGKETELLHLYKADDDVRTGGTPSQRQLLEILEPVLTGLEMLNPVLAYTGLSPKGSGGVPQHIVVISGYRVDDHGELWLHIDDPGTSTRHGITNPAQLGHYFSTNHFRNYRAGPGVELRNDNVELLIPHRFGDELAGRRFWGRASRLFEPNYWSRRNDLLCDAKCSKGLKFIVRVDRTRPEPGHSSCVSAVERVSPFPVKIPSVPAEDESPAVAQLDAAWTNVRGSGAPYPLGANRSWHNGIHFDARHPETNEVSAFAPGEIAMVRLPDLDTKTGEDGGAILLRHAFDTGTLSFVAMQSLAKDVEARKDAAAETKKQAAAAETAKAKKALYAKAKAMDKAADAAAKDADAIRGRVVWLYSMSMHLRGEDSAQRLRALLAGHKPVERLPAPGIGELLGYGDADAPLVALGATYEVGCEVLLSDTAGVESDRGPRQRLPMCQDDTNLAAWDRAPLRVACHGARPGLYDPVGETPIALEQWEQRPRFLKVRRDKGSFDLVEVKADDGGAWFETDEAANAGFVVDGQGHCEHAATHRAWLERLQASEAALFLRGPQAKFRLEPGGDTYIMWLVDPSKNDGTRGLEAFACAAGQPAVAPDAPDKATMEPRLIPCVELIEHDNMDEVPLGAPLSFYNPVTDRVYATEHVPREMRLKERIPGTAYVEIEGHRPIVRVRTKRRACVHEPDVCQRMRVADQGLWPLHCFSQSARLCAQTEGAGAKRSFADAPYADLDPTLVLAAQDGPVKTAGERRFWPKLTSCVYLDAEAQRRARDELERVCGGAEGDTLGRLLDGDSRLVGVRIGEEHEWEHDGDFVKVRREFHGKPVRLYGGIEVSDKGRAIAVEDGGHDAQGLEMIGDSRVALRRVDIFTDRRKPVEVALVEVSLGQWRRRFTIPSAEVAQWQRDAAFADEVCTKARTEVVDLIGNETCKEVRGGDVLGYVGHCTRGKRGLHFEIFAGQVLLPSDTPTYRMKKMELDNAAPTLDEAGWHEAIEKLREDRQMNTALGQRQDVARAVSGDQPFPPDLWNAFCAERRVDIALSRLVTIHPTEWAGKGGWWPKGLTLPKLREDRWHFHHPLRLIEWLRTGVDVHLDGGADAQPELTLKLDEGWDLAPAGQADHWYRMRMILGEHTQSGPATLEVEGIDTASPEIPIEICRGEVRTVRLCQPGVGLHGDKRVDGVERVYVLSNGGRELPESHDRTAVFTYQANYNLEPPKIDVAFSARRGTAELHLRSPKKEEEDRLPPGAESFVRLDLNEVPVASFRSANISLRVRVRGPDDAGAEVRVTAEGGDLTESYRDVGRVAVRDIEWRQHGEDIRLLQRYLSRIEILGRPCYRGPIGGTYGPKTARGLWRFIHYFGRHDDWDRENLAQIKASRGTFDVPAVVDAATARQLPLDDLAKHELKKSGSPVVTPPLVAEVLKQFRVPNTLPELSLSVATPDVDPAIQAKARALSDRAKSTVLPHPALAEVRLSTTIKGLEPEGASELEVSMELPDGCPFEVVDPGPRRLGELLTKPIRLRPTDLVSTDKDACTVRIEARGRELGKIRLGGTRFLEGAVKRKGLDTLQLQYWMWKLSLVDREWLGGRWKKGSPKAFARFREEFAPQASYKDALIRLRDVALQPQFGKEQGDAGRALPQ